MILLPCSNLLSVKAEAVTITTDDTKTLASDSNFKYVTNTSNLYLNNTDEYNEDESKNDIFYAYKVLDTYYDKNSNQITYDFTKSFKSFLNQLDETDTFANYTVDKYQQLTGDEYGSQDIVTSSTLNKLVSKYATFIKKQENDQIEKIQLTKSDDPTQRIARNLEVGSYLILSSSSGINPITYGAMVGNIAFTTTNGSWQLEECNVYVKSSFASLISIIYNGDLSEFGEELYDNVTYDASKKLYYGGYITTMIPNLPTNTHASITNNQQTINLLGTTEVLFSSGIVVDLNKMFLYNPGNIINLDIESNSIYFTYEGNKYKYADFTYNTDSNGVKMTFSNIDYHDIVNDALLLFELNIDDNIKVGINAGSTDNIITNTYNYLKDPYVDIGTNPTDADIKKAIGTIKNTNTVYTFGSKITNKANNEILNGAKFQMYSDEACTIKVGEEFEITENGTYIFRGMNDTNTYYLKQTKAPTGYKLLTDAIELKPEALDKQTGLYNIEVNNTKMGLLPSTGGLGTIIYTTIGLLIIVVGSIAFISYRKKQVQN